jgi:glyoxylase-like metal-dependent hydrolase (beta-lactamase superfamily II)/rhodanese-related sulfurtransferase
MTSQDIGSKPEAISTITTSSSNKSTEIITNMQLEPTILKQKMDKEENIFIVDVRTLEEFNAWKISYGKYQNLSSIPIDKLSESLEQIPKDKEIITVCSHGNRSMTAAKFLSQLGYNVKSVKGGMVGWNRVHDIALVPTVSDIAVKIWQVRRISKGCIAYVIASETDRNAVVIDPNCETIEAILEIANDNALEITKVIDTHMHADHISGATSLAKKVGVGTASVYISSLEGYDSLKSESNYDDDNNNGDSNEESRLSFNKINDGDEIQVGMNVTLKAIHTPGHTNGSMCFLLENGTDSSIRNNIKYLFTGDTIFTDGIGRPDLHNKAEEFTNNLYNTYKQKIFRLSDETIVLAAHYSKSFERRKSIFSTLKSIKKKVKFLSLSREEFIKSVSKSIPAQPVNYRTILEINKKMKLCNKSQIQDLEAGPNLCGIHK